MQPHKYIQREEKPGQGQEMHDRLKPKDIVPPASAAHLPSSLVGKQGPVSLPGLLTGSSYYQRFGNKTASTTFVDTTPPVSNIETVVFSNPPPANIPAPTRQQQAQPPVRPFQRHVQPSVPSLPQRAQPPVRAFSQQVQPSISSPPQQAQHPVRPFPQQAQQPAAYAQQQAQPLITAAPRKRRITGRLIRRHLLFCLKAAAITAFFLGGDFLLERALAIQNMAYQVVNIASVVILYSNVMSVTILRHYNISFDMLKTTLHLKTVKRKGAITPPGQTKRNGQLSDINDTTAYLRALKHVYSQQRNQHPKGQ